MLKNWKNCNSRNSRNSLSVSSVIFAMIRSGHKLFNSLMNQQTRISSLHIVRTFSTPAKKTENFIPEVQHENNKDQEKESKENEKRKYKHEQFMKRALILHGSFEGEPNKTKENYLDMIRIFEEKEKHRRNHVEFIYAALKNMEDYSVQGDLEVYKALINVMPKGKFIPSNIFQVEFMHYPKQQQCIIDLLEQMEDNGVMPDYEMEDMLINIFGRKGHPGECSEEDNC